MKDYVEDDREEKDWSAPNSRFGAAAGYLMILSKT